MLNGLFDQARICRKRAQNGKKEFVKLFSKFSEKIAKKTDFHNFTGTSEPKLKLKGFFFFSLVSFVFLEKSKPSK